MSRDQLRALIVVGLAIPFVAFHVARKKQIKPEEAAQLAAWAVRPATWQGRVAADFDLKTLDGKRFRLAEHVGREVVVLNFFATWCGPCREEMPELTRFLDRHRGRPLRLIAIDVEEKEAVVRAFVSQAKVALEVAMDESGAVARSYGVESYPTTVVIGADGSIVLHQTGAVRNADVTLAPVVRDALLRVERGEGIERGAYLSRAQTAPNVGPDGSPLLRGRALAISERMDCPCGCADKVAKCGCKTAKGIKRRLAVDKLEGRTDEQIAKDLDREFCMGGM
jgi:thiol-disulfide isomerase/thioredoxin